MLREASRLRHRAITVRRVIRRLSRSIRRALREVNAQAGLPGTRRPRPDAGRKQANHARENTCSLQVFARCRRAGFGGTAAGMGNELSADSVERRHRPGKTCQADGDQNASEAAGRSACRAVMLSRHTPWHAVQSAVITSSLRRITGWSACLWTPVSLEQ